MTTIKEIAEKAHVAIATVDRVLHNRGRVAKDKEEKIRKLIKELNYTPNAFARNLKLKKTFIFGVVIPGKVDITFWDLAMSGINKAQKELERQNVKVKYFSYEGDPGISLADLETDLRHKKVDGLVIAPVFYDVVKKKLAEIGISIPYVFFISKKPDPDCLSYIGQDAFQSGIVSAKLMRLLVPNGGTIACIGRTPADYHINERVRGFTSAIGNDPKYKLFLYDWDLKNDDAEAGRLPELLLAQHPELKGLFVPGGKAAAFAEFIRQKEMQGKIRFIGYDLIEANRYFLKNGTIDFIISQNPEAQGYKSVYALYRHLVLKEDTPKEVTVPIDIATSENMDYYK